MEIPIAHTSRYAWYFEINFINDFDIYYGYICFVFI